jgi:hypothetical protein
MKKLLIIIILVLFISCNSKNDKNHDEFKLKVLAIDQISSLKDYMTITEIENCDTLSWKLYNKSNSSGLKVKPILTDCKDIEFFAISNNKQLFIHYFNNKFYVYNFKKTVSFSDATILID